jgi:hypothetical protein
MATGLPAGQKIEFEFTPGVWTDVSADVDFAAGIPITRGRNSPFSQPSVGSMTFQLVNDASCSTGAGSYTPLSQVLADGVTPHPYYPHLLPRVRVRYSNTPAGIRFVGYVKGWPPQLENGIRGVVTIVAYDRMKYLAKVTLKSPIAQEYGQDSPNRSWQLTDPVGSLAAADAAGSGSVLSIAQTGTGGPLAFGDAGPGFGDGTGVKFTPASASAGQYLKGAAPSGWAGRADATIELWVECLSTPAATQAVCAIEGSITGADWLYLGIDNAGKPLASLAGTTINGTASIVGGWHLLTLARTVSGFNGTYTLYVDGVAVGSPTTVTASGCTIVNVGQTALTANASALFAGNIGYVSTYLGALSSTRIAAHYAAGSGYSGDTTDQRIARWLTAARLTSSDWNLDVGKAIVGTYPQAGKDIVSACQDMATTEGGGAVFYVGADGKARFTSRAFRKPGAPVLTLDAQQDLTLSPYDPAFDDETLVNSSTVTRSASSGALSTQAVTNAASIAQYAVTTGDLTSYATTDQDALNLAQSRVSADANPGFRLPQVSADLVTAQNNLYAALGATEIGSRIRITNLPAGYAPATQVDVIFEGITETPSADSYIAVFDVSPADNPARGVWDDTSYGRWQCSGQTLNANITNSATTLAIATTAGLPLFTTVSARYPLNIQIGQEVITLDSAPGATSPQTFTGVTRGAKGTQPAAQTAGATVNLWPAVTWTL